VELGLSGWDALMLNCLDRTRRPAMPAEAPNGARAKWRAAKAADAAAGD
jgi:hypothetical protein